MNTKPVILAIALIACLRAGTAAAAELCDGTPADHPAAAAFLESEAVATAVEELSLREKEPGCVFAVRTGGSCGVAGCGDQYLVGQTFSSTSVNPQSRSVLAEVWVTQPHAKVGPLRLVRIAPYKD